MKNVFGFTTVLVLLFTLGMEAQAKAPAAPDVYADPNGGDNLILCRKVEGEEKCAPATAAQALGWTRSCAYVGDRIDNRLNCQWNRVKDPQQYKNGEFAACQDVNFLQHDVISEMTEKERKYYENLAVACGPKVQILPEASMFFGELSTSLHKSARVENEAETMLQMGVTAARKTLDQMMLAGEEMQRTACCFQTISKDDSVFKRHLADLQKIKGNSALSEIDIQKQIETQSLILTGELNEMCEDRIGNLIADRSQALGVSPGEFCQARVESVRKNYEELLPKFRHELIRAGTSGTERFNKEFNHVNGSDLYKYDPGMHMNLALDRMGKTITPPSATDPVIGLIPMGRSDKDYGPISEAERAAAVADEKTWLAEIDKEWEADRDEHNKTLMPRLEQLARRMYPSLPLEEGIEKARYVYAGQFENSPRSDAFKFLKGPQGKISASSAGGDVDTYYEHYVMGKFRERREAHQENFRDLLGQAPIFAFLAKDNPTDAEISAALYNVVNENNHPMQKRFNEKMQKAIRELELAAKEGRDPDPFLAADFMAARGVFEEMLEQNPDMCAAATALAAYVNTKQTSKDLTWGLVAAGATIATAGFAGAAIGAGGGSAALAAQVSTGVGLAGGVIVGGAFLAKDNDRVALAEQAFFSVDGIATQAVDVSTPGTLQAIEDARSGQLISAATIIFPWDIKALGAAGMALLAARKVGAEGFERGARTAASVAGNRVRSFGRRLAAAQLKLSAQDRRGIMNIIKGIFFGRTTPTAAELREANEILEALTRANGPNRILPAMDSPDYERVLTEVGELFQAIKRSPGLATNEDIINVLKAMQDPTNGFPLTSLNISEVMDGIEGGIRMGMDPETIVRTLKEFDTWAKETGNQHHLKGLSKILDDAYSVMRKRYRALIGDDVPPYQRRRNMRAFSERHQQLAIDDALRRNNVPEDDIARLRSCVIPGA